MAGSYVVTDFGAVGDGKTLNTAAIQRAVDACADAGGGRVLIPAGTFVSGPIFLKSNIELHLSPGAVLRGSRDLKDYPAFKVESHGHTINEFLASLVTGHQLENVSITGRGVLDGQGDVWWAEIDAGRRGRRPVIIFLCDCENVLIEGVKVMNSPAWTILPLLCRNVTIRGVTIENPWKPYHNCDGIDVHSCSNVRIADCHIDTGDDGICLKSIPDWFVSANGTGKVDYSRPRIPCENVAIQNCIVKHAHSGVSVWAEVIGGMRNVVVSNCVFDGTRTGIQIARYPWPGGSVKNVRVNNIVMRRVEAVFRISSFCDPKELQPGPDPETTPEIANIHISNVTATKARLACESFGLPKMPVRDISFSHVRIEADKGFDFRDVENVLLDDVAVDCPGPAVMAQNARRLEIRRLDAVNPQPGIPAVQLTGCTDTWIRGCRARAGGGPFVGLVGADNPGLILDAPAGSGVTKAAVEPVPTWSFSSYAYSGSSMWRVTGHRNAFLPVPDAVLACIRREWDDGRFHVINGVQRLESGARPDILLPAGDRRRVYIVMAWRVPETLLIAGDGELLRKAVDFDYREHLD